MSIAEKITRLNTAKNDIATAIVNKGIEVAETDGLESFAEKIGEISTGGAPEWFGDNIAYVRAIEELSIFPSYSCFSFIYNNEIHIFGQSTGNSSSAMRIKFDGTSWSGKIDPKASFDISIGEFIVVYRNEVYKLSYYNLYKWSGSDWKAVSALPSDFCFYNGAAVVYNDELHIFGGGYPNSDYTKHYKWNGSSWVRASTLPYNFTASPYGCIVVYNNEIHLLGGMQTYNHYKWNGSSWISVSTLPTQRIYNAFGLDDGIIVIDQYSSKYKWDGTSWTNQGKTPFNRRYSTVLYNGYLVTVFSDTTPVWCISDI